jgi:DNA mismatch endonuclease, patch repair protein
MRPSETSPRGPAWPGVPEARRNVMRANRRRDTGPERTLRSALHALGLRFRVDMPIRPVAGRSVRPDVVFPRCRVAVYVDGCFWHGCPDHWTRSKTNQGYWDAKVAANRDRDRRTTAILEREGWTVLRFWEHEDMGAAAARVADAVRGAAAQAASPSAKTKASGRSAPPSGPRLSK